MTQKWLTLIVSHLQASKVIAQYLRIRVVSITIRAPPAKFAASPAAILLLLGGVPLSGCGRSILELIVLLTVNPLLQIGNPLVDSRLCFQETFLDVVPYHWKIVVNEAAFAVLVILPRSRLGILSWWSAHLTLSHSVSTSSGNVIVCTVTVVMLRKLSRIALVRFKLTLLRCRWLRCGPWRLRGRCRLRSIRVRHSCIKSAKPQRSICGPGNT